MAPDVAPDVDHTIKRAIDLVMRRLKPREQACLRFYYYDELSKPEISRRLGLPEERLRLIKSRALQRPSATSPMIYRRTDRVHRGSTSSPANSSLHRSPSPHGHKCHVLNAEASSRLTNVRTPQRPSARSPLIYRRADPVHCGSISSPANSSPHSNGRLIHAI